ncbi:hypothetical protein FZEAL_9154 [Fusarium zealandicum]|uniref:mRNA splicing factor RNA helicase n=1 Tax=Fusarium zealandicum TaxID=1053134 RepID=A0A8H4UCG7_9HYPO|nr:hypothetical protein FZEAL_9154 [Fusarium zealandicum]
MESSPAGESAPEPIRFRAGKKRKAYRQRAQDDDAAVAETTKSPPAAATPDPGNRTSQTPTHGHGDANDDEASVAAALKLRNARRGRFGGVAFRNANRPDDEINTERALVPHDPDDVQDKNAVVNSVTNRFTHQTGMLADLNDKHMMEYIESRLSNRERGSSSQNTTHPAPTSDTAHTTTTTTAAAPKQEGGHAVMQGHLMEIDLGDDMGNHNAAAQEGTQERRAKKPRLGRDGKPWRPRNRRGSDAIKRDQLVEQVLSETRRNSLKLLALPAYTNPLPLFTVDVYELPPEQAANASGADEDGAADERLAQEFRQQFLEDVAQRQLRKKKPTNQPARPGSEEVLKGPKLGGSRNLRAQVRDLLLKKEKEGKK